MRPYSVEINISSSIVLHFWPGDSRKSQDSRGQLAHCQEKRIKRQQTVRSAGCKVLAPNAGFLLASMPFFCRFRPVECFYSQSVSVSVPQDKIRGSTIPGIVLLTKTGPPCISFRCKITVSLAQGAVHDAEADVADPVFVRSTMHPKGPARGTCSPRSGPPSPPDDVRSAPPPRPPLRIDASKAIGPVVHEVQPSTCLSTRLVCAPLFRRSRFSTSKISALGLYQALLWEFGHQIFLQVRV